MDFSLSAEEVGDEFTESLRQFQRQARLPGFRPGKVPLDLVRKRWGQAIMAEKAEEIARRHIGEVLKNEALLPDGQVAIDLVEFGEGRPLRFKAEFPVQPQVNLSRYKGLKVLIDYAEVGDADVDAQIEALRRKHAYLRSVDTPATAECRVTVRVQEVDPSGLPLVGATSEVVQIEFGTDRLGVGSDEQLLGIRVGERRIIRVRRSDRIHRPARGSRIVKPGEADDSSYAAGEVTLTVEAIQVEVLELPEVDDQFAAQVDGRLKTAEELRRFVRYNLMDYVAFHARTQLDRRLMEKVVEENPFPVPRRTIVSRLEEVAQSLNISEDNRRQFVEEHFSEVEKDYRWVRIRDAIAQAEGIDVTDEELERNIARIVEISGSRGRAAADRYANPEEREKLRQRILESKVLDTLAAAAEVERRMMDLRQFIEEAESRQT